MSSALRLFVFIGERLAHNARSRRQSIPKACITLTVFGPDKSRLNLIEWSALE